MVMAAEGSMNRHPHMRIPAKNEPWQKQPPQENNRPYDKQETHHDTNTSRKPDSTMKLGLKYYCYGRIFASGEG